MIQKLCFVSLTRGNRMFATCSQIRYPRKSSLQESEEFSNWKKYVKSPKDGEEIISTTNFGTVRLDSMNVPKRHGVFDQEVTVDTFESKSQVMYSEPSENVNKSKPVEVATNELFLENSLRPEDEIRKIGGESLSKKPPPSAKIKSSKKAVKEELSKEPLVYQKFDKQIVKHSPKKLKPDSKTQEATGSNKESKSEIKEEKKVVKKLDEEISSKDPSTMNALQFVKKIRREAVLQKTEIENVVRHNKESEILQIGEGIQAKLKAVSRSVEFDNISGKRNQKTIDEDGGEERMKDANNLGYLDPKFLPINLEKLTSAEVEVLVQKSVLFDRRKITFRFFLLNKKFTLA